MALFFHASVFFHHEPFVLVCHVDSLMLFHLYPLLVLFFHALVFFHHEPFVLVFYFSLAILLFHRKP
jgi:hypothetical protein